MKPIQRICQRKGKGKGNFEARNLSISSGDIEHEMFESSKMSFQVRLPTNETVFVIVQSGARACDLSQKIREGIPFYKQYDILDIFFALESGEVLDTAVHLRPYQGQTLYLGVREPTTIFPSKN